MPRRLRFLYSRTGRYLCLFGFLIVGHSGYGQPPCIPEPPSTPTCVEAPILCNFNDINGYCTITKPNNNFMAPNPLCPEGGAPHNPFWFAFYAGCTDLELTIKPYNCGASGIQAAIYGYGGDGLCLDSQEQPEEFIFCMTANCFNTEQVFQANNLVIGQIYYFMIDGCSGDTCTIEIYVNTDCGPPDIGPWPGIIDGPSPICATGTGTYTVPAPTGGTIFHWYLDGSPIQEGGENSVNITFPGPGIYNLCVDVSNHCVAEFEAPSQICKSITVYEITPVDPPPVTICAEDTYSYGGMDYPPGIHDITLKTVPHDCDSMVTLTVNGFVVTNAVDPAPVLICDGTTYTYAGNDYVPGIHDVTLENFMGCDSVITLTVEADPHVSVDLGTFFMCAADTISIGGQKWFGDPPGYKEITIPKANPPKCDSTIRFLIEPMFIEAYIFPPDVLGCFVDESLLDGTGSVMNPPDAEVDYLWTALAGGELGGDPANPMMWVSTPGKYCLTTTITSLDGMFSCSDSVCVIVTELPEPEGDAWSSGHLSCHTPQVTLTGTSPTPNVTFKWLDPQGQVITTDTSTTVTLPGTYRFVVTDQTGCPNTVAVVVMADQDPPDVSALTDTITCLTPVVQLEGASLTPGVTFQWKNPSGNVIGNQPVIDAPGPGHFTLVVTNPVNGCLDSLTVAVIEDIVPPQPTASTDTLTCLLAQPPLNGGSNVPGSQYVWTFGGSPYSTQEDTVAAQSGSYTLTVIHPVNGCSKDTTIVVPEDTAPPDAQAEGDSLDCIKTIGTLTGSSATQGATFSWTDPVGNPAGNTASIQVSLPGPYVLTVTGPNGCTQTTTAEAVLDAVIPDVWIASSDDTISCAVTDIQLAGTASMPVSWEWTTPSGTVLGTDSLLAIQQSGPYVLTVTAANGCTNQATVTIGEDLAPPVIDLAQGGVIDCIASSITLNGTSSTPGVSYQWYTPTGSPLGSGPNPSVTAPGNYLLVITGYNGCKDSAQAMVTASPDLPQDVFASNDGPITCSQTSAQIEAGSSTAGVTYQWSGPGYSGSGTQASVLVPGIYEVTVTNPSNGCTVATLTTVGIDTLHPVLSTTGNLINCYNPTVPVSVQSTPSSGVSYQWADPSQVPFGGNTPQIQVNTPGIWTVTVTHPTNGCTAVATATVSSNVATPGITIPTVQPLTCANPVRTLTNTPGTGVDYQWSGPDIQAGNQQEPEPSISLPGTYAVTVTDPVNGCTSTASTVVTEDKVAPQIQLNGGLLDCNQTSLNLTGNVQPASGISVQWLRDGSPIVGSSTTLSVQLPGTYTLLVTNTSNGCTAEQSAQVTQDIAVPDVAVTEGVLTCTAPDLVLTGSSATPGVTYLWAGPGGFNATSPQPTVTVPGAYVLTVTAPNGCTNQATAQVTEDKDLPLAMASAANILDCAQPSTTLSSTGSSSGPDISYTWTNPAGQPAGTGAVLSQVNVPGVYVLTVFNAFNGCSATANVLVEENTNRPSGIESVIQDPRCFGERNGSIQVLQVDGGTPPYLYSLNGGPFTPTAQFSGLGEGTYVITVQDAAGCLFTAPDFDIMEPLPLTVELGEDFILQWGRDTFLYALISPPNAPITSILWTPAGVDTTLSSREIYIRPYNQTLYGVTVTDTAGCRAEDKVLVLVEKRRPVYIPNVFHPGGDQNTRFYIQAGDGVEEIEVLEVFNRWGERVFRGDGLPPNDPSVGWDGTFRDKPANPEVFVYYARIRFNDGITILYKGDVTLMR